MPVSTRRQAAAASSLEPTTTTLPTSPKQPSDHTDSSLTSTLVGDPTSSSSSSSSSPASSSSSSDSSDSESDSDSDDDDDDPSAALAALLLKAKQSARAKAVAQAAELADREKHKARQDDGLAGNEEVVLFGVVDEDEDDDEEEDDDDHEDEKRAEGGNAQGEKTALVQGPSSRTRRPIPHPLPPSLSRPLSFPSSSSSSSSSFSRRSLPTPPFTTATAISLGQDVGLPSAGRAEVRIVGPLGGDRKGQKGKQRELAGGGEGREGAGRTDRWGQLPVGKLSKNQIRAKQPHTAGPKWFNLPATPLTPQLQRELSALRLSNALDPKKFLRGGAQKEKLSEFFQVGHMIAPSTRASSSAPINEAKVRKRGFLEELVENEQGQAYAKKKTKEVLKKGMSGRKRQRSKGGQRGAYGMGAGGNKSGGEGGGKRRREG
ncbi:hypothetical protein JCM11641_002113 [Rhodosporidiobolus odoratus]